MYARYVPPKKKRRTDSGEAAPTPAPDNSSPHPPTITQPDASQPNARYVPPAKSSSKTSTASQNDGIAAENDEIVEAKIDAPEKKKKKNKKPEDGAREIQNATTSLAVDKAEDVKETTESREERRQKRREKKKASREALEHTNRSPSPDLVSKHKTVLARRAASQIFVDGIPVKKQKDQEDVPMEDAEPEVLHAFEPLPQPEPKPEPSGIPSISVLPSWLENPIRVSSSARASFQDMGVDENAVKALQAKGFEQAFAVQSAVLPLLLPSKDRGPGDVLVSAATGSGKTLSYVLPMINDLCRTKATRLRGLIVLPTRELVNQAREVCEICSTAFAGRSQRRLKIGVAVGSQAIKTEQTTLMEKSYKLNPEAYAAKVREQNAKWEGSDNEEDDEDFNLLEDESQWTKPGHVLDFQPAVDILICTPGRLVEHLKSTPGFTLEFTKWLVIDEADRLLDQSFQQWLEIVLGQFPATISSRRDRRLTKVILSATMTRDIGQLSSLKLYRPKMVVLETAEEILEHEIETGKNDGHVLPAELRETATKVDEDGEKPLYLLKILGMALGDVGSSAESNTSSDSSSDSSDSSSEDSSDDSSDDDSGDAESSSDSDESSSTSSSDDSSESDSDSDSDSSSSKSSSGSNPSQDSLKKVSLSGSKGALIFTKSNEATLRLSRLLVLLEPGYTNKIGTLTSTVRESKRRATIQAFRSGKLSIIVASDLVARGLDLPDLAHVINYDIPNSITSYVHRVGRTARAGKKGTSWTLFTNSEGRWFWNDIARTPLIKRSSKVDRVNIDNASFGDDLRQRYEKALEKLGKETEISARRRRI